jgi:hypothetical protein
MVVGVLIGGFNWRALAVWLEAQKASVAGLDRRHGSAALWPLRRPPE